MTTDLTRSDPPRKLSPAVRRSLARVKDLTADEADLQRVVIAYGRDHGWLAHHAQRARVKDGRVLTPTQGHAGYPDLTLVRAGRLVVPELKTQTGKVSDDQQRWLDAWRTVPCAEVFVWRPCHWATIRRTLR